jgi:hypothetical protein
MLNPKKSGVMTVQTKGFMQLFIYCIWNEVEIVQMVKILKLTMKAGYISKDDKILNKDDQTRAKDLRWGTELIGHRKLLGDKPKGFNGTSDEDSGSDESGNEEKCEEEDFVEKEGKIKEVNFEKEKVNGKDAVIFPEIVIEENGNIVERKMD